MILTKLERVPGGGSSNHDEGHDPFEQVGTDGGSEGLGVDPELGPGQHALSGNDRVSNRSKRGVC